MLETSARLLRLLSVLQTRRDWTGAELADRLGVTARTVRRDMDKLRDLGYPVHACPGASGGYRLGAGAALPPLLLDDEEAVAVAVGLRTATVGTVAGIEESSIRALAKLEQVLPSRLRHRIAALHSVTVPLSRGATVDPDTLTLVAAACRDRERLRFDYRDRDGSASLRSVEPHQLVHTGRRWYLLGWDRDREDWRTFRLDRLQPRTPTGPRFTPRQLPDRDIGEFASWTLSNAGYRYRARITLHVPVEVAAELVPPASGLLEVIDEHSCTLHTGSNSLDGLAVHVAVLGFDFEVHEPPELVEHVRVLAARLGRAAPRR